MLTEAATHLHRIDPACNMARFYTLSVGGSLFGDVAVVREWGRIGTIGRMRIDLFANENEALVALDAIERAKTRRGYQEIGGAVRDEHVVDPWPQEKRTGNGLLRRRPSDGACG